MKIIAKSLCCVLLLSIGVLIIAEGIRTKKQLPQYETFNKFQDVTYRLVWHIHRLYSIKQEGGQISNEDKEKMIAYIGDLNMQKDSLYSEIQTFPSTLDSLKYYSDSLYDKSSVVFSTYESGYKNIKNDEGPWNAYYDKLNASIRSVYYCSIKPNDIENDMRGISWLETLLEW